MLRNITQRERALSTFDARKGSRIEIHPLSSVAQLLVHALNIFSHVLPHGHVRRAGIVDLSHRMRFAAR